jgi:hypothetical protein
MRVPRSDLVGREAAPGLLGRSQVLDQDVGLRAEALEALAPAGKIDDRTTLACVAEKKGQGAVSRAPVARERGTQAARISARRLDLDDVGAELGEQATGERTAKIREIDDSQMLERGGRARHLAIHGPSPVAQLARRSQRERSGVESARRRASA